VVGDLPAVSLNSRSRQIPLGKGWNIEQKAVIYRWIVLDIGKHSIVHFLRLVSHIFPHSGILSNSLYNCRHHNGSSLWLWGKFVFHAGHQRRTDDGKELGFPGKGYQYICGKLAFCLKDLLKSYEPSQLIKCKSSTLHSTLISIRFSLCRKNTIGKQQFALSRSV
jgi:hypothetical protein